MKTKIKLRLATIVLIMFVIGFKSNAQQIYCDNLLGCDVTIFYEMYEVLSTNCVVTCNGNLTIPAGGSAYVLPDCTSTGFPCDACIIITDIGGWAPPSNHSSSNVGHVMTPYGQTGTTPASSACGPVNWTASQGVGTWIIQ